MVTGRVRVRARARDRFRATVGVKVRATGMSDMSLSVEGGYSGGGVGWGGREVSGDAGDPPFL